MRKLLSMFLFASLMLVGCGGGGGSGSSGDNKNQQDYVYFNNQVTQNLLIGTWEHTKESNPTNYSQLVKVNKSSINGYVSKIEFLNNGNVITTNCDMTIEDHPISADSNIPFEWFCDDTAPEITTEKFYVADNKLYVTDLSGNNAVSVNVETNGDILYIFSADNSISEYTKK